MLADSASDVWLFVLLLLLLDAPAPPRAWCRLDRYQQ
jgi:hypothetical protein